MPRDKSGRFTKAPKRTLESDVADCYWLLQELGKDLAKLHDRVNEGNERLRQIELSLKALANPPAPWSKAEREAFLTGLRAV